MVGIPVDGSHIGAPVGPVVDRMEDGISEDGLTGENTGISGKKGGCELDSFSWFTAATD